MLILYLLDWDAFSCAAADVSWPVFLKLGRRAKLLPLSLLLLFGAFFVGSDNNFFFFLDGGFCHGSVFYVPVLTPLL